MRKLLNRCLRDLKRKEEKVNVTKTNLLSAVIKGAVSILADGFKEIRDK